MPLLMTQCTSMQGGHQFSSNHHDDHVEHSIIIAVGNTCAVATFEDLSTSKFFVKHPATSTCLGCVCPGLYKQDCFLLAILVQALPVERHRNLVCSFQQLAANYLATMSDVIIMLRMETIGMI